MHKIINALLFQACWFAAIMVGWQLAIIPLAVLLLHGLSFERGQHDYRFVLLLIFGGILFDATLFKIGLFVSPDGATANLLGMPYWLMTLWAGFALTLGSSLGWSGKHPAIFVAACAVAGPLSYFAGMRLNALHIAPEGFVVLVFSWASAALLTVRFMRSSDAKGPAEGGRGIRRTADPDRASTPDTQDKKRSVHERLASNAVKPQICGVE